MPSMQSNLLRVDDARVSGRARMHGHAMRVLRPGFDPAQFFERLQAASERLLLLDYDGTLAPFKIRPEDATPYPGVTPLLDELMARGGTRVVLVSGRRAHEVAKLLALQRPVEVWGVHGWERLLPDGTLHALDPGGAVRDALEQAEAQGGSVLAPGTRLERKPASVAFHWRGLPARAVAPVRRRLMEAWAPLAGGGVLELMPFDGGMELRARGTNKQHAVEAVFAEATADSAAAYLGDDLTDEDAFRAVKARGVAVLVRAQLRETAADLWIRPPRELLAFLERWLAADPGARGRSG